jgi:hypothetical protein
MSNLSIADLRALRSKGFGDVTAALNKKSEYAKDDEGYFKLTADKAGNASAVIRFLPKHVDDELPWVTYYTHGIQGDNGKWLIDNCPTSIGQPCPVCEATRKLYQGSEDDKKIGAKRKRRQSYVANVLVISDPKNPENNGKVAPFKFGKKIFEKMMGAIQPTFEDDTPVNIFDLWGGAAFKLRMRKVEGYPNYDQSNFESPSEIADSDDAILKIMNQVISLRPIIAPSKFKSYAELATKLASIDAEGGGGSTAEKIVEQMRSEPTKPAKTIDTPAKTAPLSAVDEDEDLAAYFANMSK